MTTRPNCPCFAPGSDRVEERENVCQSMGAAIGEIMRANAHVHGVCSDAHAYLAGACLAGLAVEVANALSPPDSERISHEEIVTALELVVTAARERIDKAKLQFMEIGGSA